MNVAQPAGRPGRRRRWAGARVRRHSFRHASGQAMGDRNECRSTGRAAGSGQAMGRRKSSPTFISARVWTGDGQAQEFAEIHFGTRLDRRWAGARVRRNSFRHASGQAMGDRNECRSTGRAAGSGQAMGRRKSSPTFISARVWTGDGQAQEFAEIHFGTRLDRRWAGARVRRHSFRHASGQAMGRRKSSPKFISARVWTGDGQAQEFADIHFGTGQGRQWETEMNFGQPAGRPGRRRRWATARVRRNSFRHGSGQAMGDRNEFRSTGRASGSAQAMGRRKSSPTFISAWVWAGDG
jgi:hypothetical protein